jgi:hypothetical protein
MRVEDFPELLDEAKRFKMFFSKKYRYILFLRNKLWGFSDILYFETTHIMLKDSECYFVYTGCSENQLIEIVPISM